MEEIKEMIIGGEVKQSDTVGNCIVATRSINKGELVLEEFPASQGPTRSYGCHELVCTKNIPELLCLVCARGVLDTDKCSACQWPLCQNGSCNVGSTLHSMECQILSSNGVTLKNKTLDYTGILVLRTLLLRDTNPQMWEQVLKLESHLEARRNSDVAKNYMEQLIEFIRSCSLDFSSQLIEHVSGVLEINPYFMAYDFKGRFGLLLFLRMSLFAHSCDPNVDTELLEKPVILDSNGVIVKKEILLRVRALRQIQPGELMTMTYNPLSDQTYEERQKFLKETFYFDCACELCLKEKPSEV